MEDAQTSAPSPDPPRWVLLAHQLPAQPSRLRVKVWRRLQALGAVAIRQSVYALPLSPQAVEDFQWLRREIVDAGGEATVFTADGVNGAENRQIVHAFRQARQRDYARILEQLHALEQADPSQARRADSCARLRKLRHRLERLCAVDFFQADGQAEALAALQRCAAVLEESRPETPEVSTRAPEKDPARYRGRRWVTRSHVHIDRVASAWLIRRYIDPEARFAFVAEGAVQEDDDVSFDMFEAEFGHRGDACTFETLKAAFGLEAPGLELLSRIVHDADLKDGKFGRRDAAGIEKVIRALGLRLGDEELVSVGLDLFDGLIEILSEEVVT